MVIVAFFVSCSKKVEAEDISKMNGYWEIEKVVFPDGKEKKYDKNDMYDYFEIKDFVGIRKKVTPVIDGTYLVNLDAEKVQIKEGKDRYMVHYSKFYTQWEEELVSICNDEMVLKNENNTEYHYKKVHEVNLLKDGKKAK